MNSTPSQCRLCGLPKTVDGSGSLTQFISVCQCDFAGEILDSGEFVDICAHCHKRIGAGRKGSFTQFIFRSQVCSCKSPEPIARQEAREFFSRVFDGFEIDELESEELNLSADRFPVKRYIPFYALGSGANGEVYLAKDRLLGKRVAVKVLKIIDAAQAVDFQNEARTTSKLDHPNIVRILDFGCTEDEAPYMVLDFAPGVTLKDYLAKENSLSIAEAGKIFSQLCDALEYAHSLRIFHRDIKPENIILTGLSIEEAEVMLIDFGVASTAGVSQDTTVVQGRTLVGTPAYMSPDQGRGVPYDRRSEVYSLGCVLYEALSGRPPFDAEDPLELLRLHSEEDLPELNPGDHSSLNARVNLLLRKAMEKSQEDRFNSMSEFKEALAALVSTEEDRLESEVVVEKRHSKSKNSNMVNWLFAGCLSVILLIGLLFAFSSAGNKLKPVETEREATLVSPGRIIYGSMKFEDGVYYLPRMEGGTVESNKNILKFVVDDLKSKYRKERSIEPYDRLCLRDYNIDCESFSELAKLPIHKLYLAGAKIDDDCLRHLKSTPLRSLSLTETGVTGDGIKFIREISTLTSLDLSECDKLKAGDITCLHGMSRLHAIRLDGLPLSPDDVSTLLSCKNLSSIFLNATTITPSSLSKLADLKEIKILTVGYCKKLDAESVVPITAKHKELTVLNIQYLPMKPGRLGYILQDCRNFKHLNLAGLPLNDKDMEAIVRQKSIDSLAFRWAKFTDKSIVRLAECKELKSLIIHGCSNVSEEAIAELVKLKGTSLSIVTDKPIEPYSELTDFIEASD